MKKSHFVWILIVWTTIITVSFIWNFYLVKSSNNEIVLNKSRAFFEQIVVTRTWNSEHGGVYVPVTEKTESNPYLKDSLKDIITIDGMHLTKVNPAFMTRQIAEENKLEHDLQFHITSLNPIRPANTADSWETKSLKLFESGIKENMELVVYNSTSLYRYMAPLITEKSCLKCHAEQGYKYGDIRGGISISFAAMPFINNVSKQIFTLGIFHFILLILGIIGLWVYYRMTNKYLLIIENRNKELTKANSERDKFFSIIAHDLRSPFSAFLGLTKIMHDEVFTLSKEEIQNFSKGLNDSAENLYKLLENLLAWSRLKRNAMEFNPETLNLKEVVDLSSNMLKTPIENKNQNVSIDIAEDISVFADREMLNSIVRNLLSNASKFTGKGNSIYISAAKKENQITICIKDTGIGIPESMIDKLFVLGENTSRYGTEDEPSSGLGLILCKEFVDKNKGEIWVESSVGIGSSFYFSLPRSNTSIN